MLSWKASPRINGFFKRSQILTGIVLALSHGTNDAQKTMGVITLALVTSAGTQALTATSASADYAEEGWPAAAAIASSISTTARTRFSADPP